MNIAPSAAANAYALASRITEPAQAKSIAGTGDSGFGDMVAKAVSAVEEAGVKTDQAAMAASVGKADIVDVVTAVAETELALETLVTVRDRVIGAYEEIMRMPI